MEATSSLDQPGQSIPQDSDVYVNYYGLAGDPFSPDRPLFFTTPHLEKLLRLFNYLTRFSRKLVVVTGEPGAGKTALLEHFVQDQNEEDQVCYFAALSADTPEQVLHEIADQLEVDNLGSGLSANDLAREIQAFSLARLDEGCSCIVVIDDAHLLDVSALKQLYSLTLDNTQARCAIRLLLCGEERLIEELGQVVPAELAEKTIFHQQINPLSFEETRQYLDVHFKENGGQNKAPFHESEYQRIYDASLGLPGRINEAAKQLMVDAVNRLVEEEPTKRKPRFFSLLILLALLIVSTIFWWQNKSSEKERAPLVDAELTGQIERDRLEITDDELEVDEIFAQPAPEELAETLPADAGEEMVESAASPEKSIGSVAENNTAGPVVAADTQASAQTEKPAPSPVLEVLPESGVISSQKTASDFAGDLQSEGTGDSPSSSSESLLLRHSRQILALDKSAYTMQLLGSRSPDSILTTMNKLPDDKNLLYFQKMHKGAPWYVLIYGNYPNKATADSATANLPNVLGNLKPWVRGVAGIQKEVILPPE